MGGSTVLDGLPLGAAGCPLPPIPYRAAFAKPLPAHFPSLHSRGTATNLPPTCYTRSFASLNREVASRLHIFERATAARGSGLRMGWVNQGVNGGRRHKGDSPKASVKASSQGSPKHS